MATDLIELKHAVEQLQKELQTNEARYYQVVKHEDSNENCFQQYLEGTGLGWWDWDVMTGEVTINQREADRLGYQLGEIEPLIESWEEVVHPEDMPGMTRELIRHLEGKTDCYEAEYRLHIKTGEWRWIRALGKVLARDRNGNPLRIVGTTQDITDQKKLLQAEREQRALAEALREVGIALSSTLDSEEILDLLLDQVARVVPYDSANIMLLKEGEVTRVSRQRGYAQFGQEAAEQIVATDFEIQNTPYLRWMAETAQPLVISDTAVDPNWVAFDFLSHVRSWAGAPITIEGQVIAFFSLDKTTPDFYQPKHARLLSAFAGQASLALQNAHLLEAARRRAEEAETLRQAGAVVVSTLQLDEAIERILKQLKRVVPHDSATVQLVRDGYLEIVGGHGWQDLSQVVGLRFPLPGDQPNTRVIERRKPLFLSKAEFKNIPIFEHVKSWLGVPLLLHSRVIGLLSLDSTQPNHFTRDHVRLVSAFADQVAIAIENARLFEAVQRIAITDPLSGLYNRHYFFELARREFERARRYRRPLSIILMDLDNFKQVNDHFGHIAGDEVLQTIAGRFHISLRQTDLLGRYGGDEFVAMLPETQLPSALKVAERLSASIRETSINVNDHQISLTMSLGVATLDDECTTLEVLIDRADQAQYRAKRAGKNRISRWEDTLAKIA